MLTLSRPVYDLTIHTQTRMLFTIRTFGAILSALATSSLVNAAPTEAEILKIEAKGIPRTCIPQPGQITLMSEAAFPDQNTTATRVSCDPTSAKNGYIFSPNADGTFGSFNMKLSGDKASRHLQVSG